MTDIEKNRTFVFGVDGASYDLIREWADEGKLPNFKKLMDEGSSGLLRSVPNMNSAAAWSSFMTGKNPGKHGLFFFHEHIKDSFKLKFLNSSSRNDQDLWSILSDAGKDVAVVNVPMTYPSSKVKGCMIAGLDTPSINSERFTYPEGLYRELIENTGSYTIESDMGRHLRRGNLDAAIQSGVDAMDERTNAVKYLMHNKPWDFFMVVYRVLDNVQHHFWKYFDSSFPFYDSHGAKKYGDTILKMYQRVDSAIGETLKNIPDDVTIIVHSDHGAAGADFGPRHLNDFLSTIGLLSFHGKEGKKNGLVQLAKRRLNKLIDFADMYSTGSFRQFLKSRFPKLLTRMAAEKYYPNIDWGNSKAYNPINRPEIWINLKGREPIGTVDEEEYGKICDFIIDRLYEWRDPETKEKVIDAAWKRSEVYKGASVEKAADIILRFKNGVFVTGIDLPEKYKRSGAEVSSHRGKGFDGFVFGKHADNGVVIMKGKNIKKGKQIEGCNIVDLAPTILYLMGEQILPDMDGKIISSAIEENFLNSNEARYSGAGKEDDGMKETTYSEDDADLIKNRLKDLGYVE